VADPSKALWRTAGARAILANGFAGGTLMAGVLVLGDEIGRHSTTSRRGLAAWSRALVAYVTRYRSDGSEGPRRRTNCVVVPSFIDES